MAALAVFSKLLGSSGCFRSSVDRVSGLWKISNYPLTPKFKGCMYAITDTSVGQPRVYANAANAVDCDPWDSDRFRVEGALGGDTFPASGCTEALCFLLWLLHRHPFISNSASIWTAFKHPSTLWHEHHFWCLAFPD